MNWQSFFLCVTLTPGVVSAQVVLDWQTIHAGGDTTAGSAYTLVGTIGQPDAGTLSGGTYSLAGGFWGGIAVQTPGAPVLLLSQTATNIVLSWQVSSVNYQLQEKITLSMDGAWSVVAQPRTTNIGRIFVTIPPDLSSRFYRLKSE